MIGTAVKLLQALQPGSVSWQCSDNRVVLQLLGCNRETCAAFNPILMSGDRPAVPMLFR